MYRKKDDDSLVILKEINIHDLNATERVMAKNEVETDLLLYSRKQPFEIVLIYLTARPCFHRVALHVLRPENVRHARGYVFGARRGIRRI